MKKKYPVLLDKEANSGMSKRKKMKNKIKPNIKDLEKAFNGDLDLMLFYLTWIKNGLNATQAYVELHPGVTRGSAEVLGSRLLGKVSRREIMKAYGLDQELYFQQLKEGVKAERRDQFSGEMYPDHKTRKDYHDKLGKLLGIETDTPQMQQTNIEVVVTRGE